MTAWELKDTVDAILLKRARGEKLTLREERILAYAVYGSRCRCGVRR